MVTDRHMRYVRHVNIAAIARIYSTVQENTCCFGTRHTGSCCLLLLLPQVVAVSSHHAAGPPAEFERRLLGGGQRYASKDGESYA
jgi:hypothetical protein